MLVAPADRETMALSKVYNSEKIKSLVLYWISLGIAVTPVLNLFKGEPIFINDSIVLILWDYLGVVLTHLFIVLIDVISGDCASESKGAKCNCKVTSCALSVIKGLISTVVFGPGFTFYNYIAKREERVEAAGAAGGKGKTQ